MIPRRTAWSRIAVLIAALASSTDITFALPTSGPIIESTPALADRFPFHASSRNFEIHSEQRIALETYLSIAETTLSRTREWLDVQPTSSTITQIYIANDTTSLALIEGEHGIDVAPPLSPGRQFRGRCFADDRVIVVPFDSGSLRWQVAHEVTHLVFHEIVGRNVEIVNEGLAELVPWWILGGARNTPESGNAAYDLYDRRLAQAVLAREVPSFTAFLNVEEQTFYDEHANWLWYALSWKLSKVLVESRDPTIHGRVRQFLDALASGMPVMPALASVYDLCTIESAWSTAIESVSPWRPLFGDWRTEGNVLVGSVSGPHSACVTSADPLDPGEAFTIELTFDAAPDRESAFGFAFDVRDVDNFAYVEFRPGCGRVAIAERESGCWTRVDDYALDATTQAALVSAQRGRRIALRATGRGRLDMIVDGTSVFRFELGRRLYGGVAGVMFENCDMGASENDTTEMRFGAVTITH